MDTGRCRAVSKKLSVSWRMAHLLMAKYSPPVSSQTQTKIASAFFIAYDPITLVQERSPVDVRGRVLPGVRLFQLAVKSAYLLLQVDNGSGRGRFFASLGPIRPLRSRCCISSPHKSGRCGSGARLMSAIPQQRREISPEVRVG